MATRTVSQKMAEAAYLRTRGVTEDEYKSFAREFPSLIHACGLAQAVAFAAAKGRGKYLEDLAAVLNAAGHADMTSRTRLETAARESPLTGYLRLSRSALQGAGWLKRYVEALEG